MTILGDSARKGLAPKSSMRLTAPGHTMPQAHLSAAHTKTPAGPAGARLGERLRQLRVAAGLTQTDLAGERFSKEYVSQIERGKTRPTRETIEWIAQRLGPAPRLFAPPGPADGRRPAGRGPAPASDRVARR